MTTNIGDPFNENEPLTPRWQTESETIQEQINAIEWPKECSEEEIQALLNRFPFLQINDPKPNYAAFSEVFFIEAESGWTIIDYECALVSSPGSHFFFTDTVRDDDDSGGGIGMPPGVGTIVKQAFDTADFMVALAAQRGWSAIYIVDGHPNMQWAAWVASQKYGIDLLGYEPSESDRQRLRRLQEDTRKREPKLKR